MVLSIFSLTLFAILSSPLSAARVQQRVWKDAEESEGFTRHCIAAGGSECWDEYLPALRLRGMCGLSGGSGYPVVSGGCQELGYTCRSKAMEEADWKIKMLLAGLGTWTKPASDGVCRAEKGWDNDQQKELYCCTEAIIAAGEKAEEPLNAIQCLCDCDDVAQASCTAAGKTKTEKPKCQGCGENQVFTATPAGNDDCEEACDAAYANSQGVSYHGTCMQYCKKAASGEEPCEVCKQVTYHSGYNEGCQFFMKAFNDATNPKCYHKPLHAEECPKEEYMEDDCNFVGYGALKSATPLAKDDCEEACDAAYANSQGMSYHGTCMEYCKKAAAGEEPCEVCKQVTYHSGYNEGCQFFMKAFNDETNPKCYHKPLHAEECPKEEYMEDNCNFVGYGALKSATPSALKSEPLAAKDDCEEACDAAYANSRGVSYHGTCMEYCKKAAAGEEPCEVCKYVTYHSGYNEGCQFFMKAFNDESNPKCYHKPLHAKECPKEEYMEDNCNFVGYGALKSATPLLSATPAAKDDCEEACDAAYAGSRGVSYRGTCVQYCKKAAAGEEPCEVCKYVTYNSGYNEGCQYFMKAFNFQQKPNCYHKALHNKECPKEEYMEDNCNFIGYEAMRKAIESGEYKVEE